MKPRLLSNIAILAVLGALLTLSTVAYGDDHSLTNSVVDQMEKVGDNAENPVSEADRTQTLQSSLKTLDELPPLTKPDHKHLQRARAYIKSALFELQNGDQGHRAGEDIRGAISELRFITADGL